jgi:hypothetical protein
MRDLDPAWRSIGLSVLDARGLSQGYEWARIGWEKNRLSNYIAAVDLVRDSLASPDVSL